MIRLILTACALACAFSSASARAQVLRCAKTGSPVPDGRLQAAIDELKQTHPELAFPQDDDPCGHEKATARAIARTFGRSYMRSVAGYELVKVVNAESYFTVERFRIGNASDLCQLEGALEKCRPFCSFAVEEATCVGAFRDRDDLVLMVSSANGCRRNWELFQQVRAQLVSPPQPPRRP